MPRQFPQHPRTHAELVRLVSESRPIRGGSVVLGSVLEAMRRDRSAADKILKRDGIRPVVDTYSDEWEQMVREIDAEMRRRTTSRLGPTDVAFLMALTRRKLRQVIARVAASATSTADTLATDAISRTRAFLATTAGEAAGISPAIARSEMSTILHDVGRQRAEALGRVGSRIEQRIGSTISSLPTETTQRRPADIIHEIGDDSEWEIVRVARTEAAATMASGQSWAVLKARHQFPDLMSRWTEHVNDLTGAPMDKRVGQDSMVLHGQVTVPGGTFTMPPDLRAPTGMIGMSWNQPPNRCNDRSVITPWRLKWGVPAWVYLNGDRVTIIP